MGAEWRPSVLSISLDSQIASPRSGAVAPMRGDPLARQRRYAAGLRALHVVVKTRSAAPMQPVPLAPNAWAYATRSASRYTFVLDAVRTGLRVAAQHPVDVVTGQDPFGTGVAAWILARRLRTPLNVQVHFDILDNPLWIRERPENRALNVLGKWVLRRAETVRVGTTVERDKLARLGLRRDRIYVAPVPVDLERFVTAAPDVTFRAKLGGDSLVLNASRLVAQKDLPTLLRAAAIVTQARPGVRFAIAGDGPLRADLEQLRDELGVREHVHFLGLVDQDAMPGLTAASDALCVSSVYEGTSLVTVQATAAGKPVVTTAVAGAGDTVVDGRTGFVVPIGDAPALASALLAVLEDPDHARAMGEAGRDHVRAHFDPDRCVTEVLRMWRETAAMSARR